MHSVWRSSLHTLLPVVVACCPTLGTGAVAQTVDDPLHVTPRELPHSPAAPTVAPPRNVEQPVSNADKIIIPELKGLRLVAKASDIAPGSASGSGVTVQDLPLLANAKIQSVLSDFIGRPLTFGAMAQISQAITDWYRARHHPFVDVAFPPQGLANGVLQAVVTEFRAGKITVNGNRWFETGFLRDQLRIQSGEPIDDARLDADVQWINQNPFIRSSITAQKSETPGGTDLTLDVQDRFPLSAYAEYANDGPPALTRDRWRFGANWGDAFGEGQQLAYQLTASDDFFRRNIGGSGGESAFVAHALNYEAPLPWRDMFTVSAFYERATPRLGPFLGLTGTIAQVSLRYVKPLPALDWLTQQLSFGYDFKSSNSTLNFGGFLVSSATAQVDQFSVTYDATASDAYGTTILDNEFFFSPGRLTSQNNDAAFRVQANNPYVKARYGYDRLSLTRYQPLWSLLSITRLTAQFGSQNLLPSEQLQAGGIDSVRGYDEDAANGSRGILLSEELRAPAFSVLQQLSPEFPEDQMQLDVFWDYASLYNHGGIYGIPAHVALSSVGVGAHYVIAENFTLRFEYGWQLDRAPNASRRGEQASIDLTISY